MSARDNSNRDAPGPRATEPRPDGGTGGARAGSESAPRPARDRAWTVGELLGWTVEKFSALELSSPRVDAEHLLASALGCTRMELYMRHDELLSATERAPFREMVTRRLAREPVAYILGRRGFHALDLELEVNPAVLIPRPETEHLVDWLLEDLRPPPAPPMRVLDVGTGSGAIALAVRRARPDVEVVALDVSSEALAVARANAERANLDVAFVEADLRAGVLGALPPGPPLSAVAANLPYIPAGDLEELAPEVARYEPRLALDGGRDGLDLIRPLVEELAGQGAGLRVYLEVGAGQAEPVADLLRAHAFVEVAVREDYAGIGRVVAGRVPPIAEN